MGKGDPRDLQKEGAKEKDGSRRIFLCIIGKRRLVHFCWKCVRYKTIYVLADRSYKFILAHSFVQITGIEELQSRFLVSSFRFCCLAVDFFVCEQNLYLISIGFWFEFVLWGVICGLGFGFWVFRFDRLLWFILRCLDEVCMDLNTESL